MRTLPLWLLLASVVFSGCTCSSKKAPPPMTAGEHDAWFPIGAGAVHALDTQTSDGVISCESCHRSGVMKEVTCLGCHPHPLEPVDGHDINESLHLGAPDFRSRVPAGADPVVQSQGCYFCHPAGKRLLEPFPHAGIPTGVGTWCGACHAVDRAFAALPVSGFTHADVGASDCGACHTTQTWKGAAGSPSNTYDPSHDVAVDALTPAWSGPTIVSVTPNTQTLHMTMNHGSRALDAGVLSNCTLCHAQTSTGAYAPGVMHRSLTSIGVSQPSSCVDCHASIPSGFVGRLDARRTPATGAMRHDAVSWANGAPTTTRLVATDCAVCHRAPDQTPATFTSGTDGGVARFHASLGAAGASQPGSCLDCHANSRPFGTVTTATLSFDHSTALGDCKDCHASTTTWASGKFHSASSPAPTTCLPCHDSARPTSTAGWVGPYAAKPFDFGTNAAGITHGDGLDCATCHTGPGTGAWGVSANWQGGHFDHAPQSVAGFTCITCHSTQRPDRLTPPADAGFDHVANGASDCFGCHQATVARGSYASLMPVPGGDWRGGAAYPGATPVTSATQFVSLPSTALIRSGTRVTGLTTTTVNLPNAFVHTSASIPSVLSPGSAGTPNASSCWHCHTSTGTTVTAYADGTFHSALASFRASPTAAITPLPQPAVCFDCHRSMRPPNIVSRLSAGTWLLPMDHAATFDGGTVASVAAMDCVACHKTPGTSPTPWSDGVFHANVPTGAAPADCVSCHYPVSATSTADVASISPTAMKHRSGIVSTQACATCHTGALAKSTTTPVAASLWRPGAYHPSLGTAQPATCLECHSGSAPTAATQSTVTYALTLGGTASNGGQWMNHTDPSTAGKDCATCHQADAKPAGSAWSRSSAFHAQVAASGACAKCHGLGNGQGTTPGTNNNLPVGLVDSDTVTTSSAAAPGTRDQIDHADITVSGKDCGVCHTQVGPSTVAGVQGREWAQASFHTNVSASVLNGGAARCSTCHLNVKPGPSYTALDHSSFSGTSAQDCGSCHAFPGSSASTPNWKGATGTPLNTFDPAADVSVDALTPAWSGPVIASVAPNPQTLHMTMNHDSRALSSGVRSNCALCHAQASLGSYVPGVMHQSLTAGGAPQPTSCADCHASTPQGFVGALDSRRAPATGPMRHDAVSWSNGAPTAQRLVASDCSVCHRSPAQSPATFATGKTGGGVLFHASLGAAGASQPGSCLDCHANSRATGVVATATFSFDHSTALGDCKDCHASTSTWAGGKFHTGSSPAPATCSSCHEAARPTSTAGWVGPYTASPFDYGTNAAGITHGDGLDCATCHTGPGTGTWGVNANWQGGRFSHGGNTVAATTCITCHSTQRPDLLSPPVNPGFDHATNGASDCIGCHQATVARGRYVSLTPIPGGDWRGGAAYPGAAPVTSATQFVRIPSTALVRTGAKVTGMTTTTVNLPNAFLHTSAAIPSAISPGTSGTPNQTSCWHCHTATGTTVTSYADGRFHAALTAFRTSPTAAITPLPQPTACLDCHDSMRPPNIVSKLDGGTWVQPMDHAATFTGGSVAGAAAMDCAACHHTPGTGPTKWSDGVFHANVPAGAAPADCVSCHYPLSTTSAADVASGSPTAMKHRSGLVTTQACATCHTGALAKSTTTPTALSLWRPGAFHPSLGTTQPASCLECHSGSAPKTATQSTVTYALALGGTATNGGQWMNHADPTTAGKDCATCHASDAKSSGSAWSRATPYHARSSPPGACTKCHGLGNGLGTTPGTNNNLPVGLVDSDTLTTSSAAAPGTRDQLDHADVNVSGKDCGLCHTQAGPSTVTGVRGKEWAQASFHQNVSASAVNGGTARCSTCHLNVKPGPSYGAFDHSAFTGTSAQDCSSCHSWPGTSPTTPNWKGAVGVPPSNTYDPTTDVTVTALTPSWSGPVITRVAPNPQTLHMTMNHGSRALDAGVLNNCALCHAQASLGAYLPGVMHWSLTTIGLPQPSSCADCHTASPDDFVGRLDSRRTPSTGAMRHDAVSWSNGAPTTTRLVSADCSVCHRAPDDQVLASFATGKTDGGVLFHASLGAARASQPGSCLDCHANSRPTGTVTTATLSFDHSTALGDCKDCHASTSTWAGGKFHTATGSAPTTCLPCHDSARPTSTAGWVGPYAGSPFDYGTNAAGITHGDGLDCATCHTGPGTGTWGVNANWRGGFFKHGPGTVAATTCITCHSTQRPDLLSPPVNPGFDHATNGASDCIGCHQPTVARGSYVSLMPIPGGDWRGGAAYPGATPVTSATQFVRIPSTALTRSGTKVTGMTTTTVTLPNAFLHTSAAIPSAISPGTASTPNASSCWHCHTATGTTVTSYADGKFHASLTAFRTSPTAAITPLPQPATCLDCHDSMQPPNIVSKLDGGTWLQPMDHAATFSGGSVAAMDCASCHRTPGLGPTGWSDGLFHANTPAGTAPTDCVGCHYPLMTLSVADVASGSLTAMKHRSSLVTLQACATCHTGALAKGTTTPRAVSLWRPGAYHPSLGTTQPATCLDCHSASDPTTATQSTVTYTLSQGATATNGGQWMNHADPPTASKDCATCHTGDAKASGSAWSRSSTYHAHASTPGACARCHGLTNGKGTTPGTNNNLPSGLVDSVTLTTSSAAAAGTHDQLSHTDVNVSGKDCGACHTQKGPSTVAGVQGKEWAQAAFHMNFTTASPLVMNGTTGRCSNCHLNVKPGTSYTTFNHSAFSGTSAQDCSSCHTWPGTSTTTPNWKGAAGMPHGTSGSTATSTLDCATCHGPTGTASERISGAVSSHFGGVSNGNRCTSCHVDFSGFTGTTAVLKYGHTNATANSGGCRTCHAFASSLYTTLTTTPKLSHPTATGASTFSQTFSVTGTNSNDSFTDTHAGTKLTLCGSCHQYTSTTASTNIWSFVHKPNNPGITNSKTTNGCNECH